MARFRAAAFTLDGRGVLGTGIESVEESSVVVFQDLWQYDPQGDAWTRLPGFPGGARGAAVSFVLGSRGYVGTGMDAYRQNLRDFWSCEPAVTAVTPSGDDIHSPVRVVPNPFVSETTLSFRVDTCQDLGVDLFSANGCLIRRLRVEQSGGGMANAVWDGKTSEGLDAFSGVYLYRIRGGGKIAQGKLLLMRE